MYFAASQTSQIELVLWSVYLREPTDIVFKVGPSTLPPDSPLGSSRAGFHPEYYQNNRHGRAQRDS